MALKAGANVMEAGSTGRNHDNHAAIVLKVMGSASG